MGAENDTKPTEPTEPTPPAEPTPAAEPTKPAEPTEPTPPDDGDVKDKHGQPGINKERHDKEVAELKARIAELEEDAKKNAETKEGREKLEKQIEELKKDMADKDIDHKLEIAGCRDLKAAKVRLEDFDGDISKLKSECPYLFADERSGSTGKPPKGAASGPAKTIREGLKG